MNFMEKKNMMSMSNALINTIIGEEGFRQFPYKDTTGHWTIGFGRNLEDHGISRDEAQVLLLNDIKIAINELDRNYPSARSLDVSRQMVLIDMCFNLGIAGLMEFRKMLDALSSNNYKEAAQEIMNSKLAQEEPIRAAKWAYKIEGVQ